MSAEQNPSSNQPGTQAPRFDIYGGIHKALRRAMCGLLVRFSSTDFSDDAQSAEILRELRVVLTLNTHHLKDENLFYHPAIEERAKGTSARVAHQHEEHEKFLAELRQLADSLEKADAKTRPSVAQKLYLRYGVFVGESLLHMAEEEQDMLPHFHKHFSDAELNTIVTRLRAQIPPDVNMAFMCSIIPALSRPERAMVLGGMKAHAPPEAFNAVMQVAARPNLSAEDWKDLTTRLGIPA
ncbi:MAG TPA: hemerythrin domain-containing protein [Archangium sp.]|jgi:hypothetical protein|uniref:hemerythrin domain-containing protein n=1 Tax=Archangium sp. TaxID=1872627 RepID=UPI002EDB2872